MDLVCHESIDILGRVNTMASEGSIAAFGVWKPHV
jgi:hypothetical protein